MRYRERVEYWSPTYCGFKVWRHTSHPLGVWYPQPPVTYTYNLYYSSTRGLIRGDRCYDQLHAGPPFKSGGPFDKWKTWDGGLEVLGKGIYSSPPAPPATIQEKYEGGFVCNTEIPAGAFPESLQIAGDQDYGYGSKTTSFGDVSSYGATGWAKYKPGQAEAGVGQFLAEASQIPRMLQTTARGFKDAYVGLFGKSPRRATKRAADHWLNHQYGWIPFVSDLRDFTKVWKKSDEMISQLRRDNNQWIKRAGTVHTDLDSEDHSEGQYTLHWPDLTLFTRLNPYYPDRGWYRMRVVTSQRVWFSARFRYYIPDIQSVSWERSARRRLWGLNLNPSLVWELTPWSWLVDWGSNVGDVFANMDNQIANNLVAKYAYVMGTTQKRLDVTSHMPCVKPSTLTWSFQLERKQRVKANPFGFGLTLQDLSPRQLSILGALGITRLL